MKVGLVLTITKPTANACREAPWIAYGLCSRFDLAKESCPVTGVMQTDFNAADSGEQSDY